MKYPRQALHLDPPHGWLNDPNGLCFYNNYYHVFFQYGPDSATGAGEKCWGHYKSKDFSLWKFCGISLYPTTSYDRDGVYSGSAVSRDGKMYLFYTGNVKHKGNYDYILSGREGNTILTISDDGQNFDNKKLLMTNSDYPDYCSCHVRDPKVWYDDKWHMLLGARSKDSKGFVMLYESDDGENWNHVSDITADKPFGYMWECPDLLIFDSDKFLSVSPQGLSHEDTRFQNVYQSGWFPLKNGKVFADDFQEWDYGFDFYAPQSFVAPDGRRIMIGWMGLPDIPYSNPTVADGRQHCLTIPREITQKGGKLFQNPIRELDKAVLKTIQIHENGNYKLKPPFMLEANPDKSFSVGLTNGPQLRYDKEKGLFTLDFSGSKSGYGRTIRKAQVEACDSIKVIVDYTSLEIFLNDGETVFSTRYYPDDTEVGIVLSGTDAQIKPMKPMEVDLLEA